MPAGALAPARGAKATQRNAQRPATKVVRYGRFEPLAESDKEEEEIPDLVPDLVPDLERNEDKAAGFSLPGLAYLTSFRSS